MWGLKNFRHAQIMIVIVNSFENTVGKEEKAGYQHFQKGRSNLALFGNGLTLYSIDTHLTHQQKTIFEYIVGKGEIARHEQFLLFQQCFLLNQIIVSPFVHIFDIVSSFAAELEEPKIST